MYKHEITYSTATHHHHPGFRKTRFFAKEDQPTGFYWVFDFIGFLDFLFERAVKKLVG